MMIKCQLIGLKESCLSTTCGVIACASEKDERHNIEKSQSKFGPPPKILPSPPSTALFCSTLRHFRSSPRKPITFNVQNSPHSMRVMLYRYSLKLLTSNFLFFIILLFYYFFSMQEREKALLSCNL
jgi:hypothetical protein